MKEIEFYSDENLDISEIAKTLFVNSGKHDPSSIYYARKLERPDINWLQIIINITFPVTFYILSMIFLLKKGMHFLISATISFIPLLVYILSSLKKVLICSIRIYQYFAPDSIRMKCRFEPSCSQYMIMALEKYGVIKGLTMGIKRLGRCKIGNGGYDFP